MTTTAMTIDQIGVGVVLAIALGFLLRRALRTVRGAGAATGGCDHCAHGGGIAPATTPTTPSAKRRAPTTPPR